MSGFEPHFGEVPKTTVKDNLTSINVDVRELSTRSSFLSDFASCGYQTKFQASEKLNLEKMMKQGTLWQVLEAIQVKAVVTGVSRIFTHQFVRQRIGIVFSQQCSGEVDWRHADILAPRILRRSGHLAKFIDLAISAKMLYAEMVDSKEVSLQEARHILPHCLETHILFSASLSTILAIFQKRNCAMTNCIEMVQFALKLRDQVVEQWPELSDLFRMTCGINCFYEKIPFDSPIVVPWTEKDDPDGHQRINDDPIYDKNHYAMVDWTAEPLKPIKYNGWEIVE